MEILNKLSDFFQNDSLHKPTFTLMSRTLQQCGWQTQYFITFYTCKRTSKLNNISFERKFKNYPTIEINIHYTVSEMKFKEMYEKKTIMTNWLKSFYGKRLHSSNMKKYFLSCISVFNLPTVITNAKKFDRFEKHYDLCVFHQRKKLRRYIETKTTCFSYLSNSVSTDHAVSYESTK